ncbi:MAG: ABC transporter substrate-binding protein [Micrococcales bacterium 73-13]|nr:MAG: ABC transporter substrate-binding protein [Micrococcales bacterium 73-13]
MRHSTRRGLLAASTAATAAAALALAGCSPSAPAPGPSGDVTNPGFEPLTSIRLQLQWLPQAQFAGYYVAQEKGFFQEEGFTDVEIVPSGGDIVPQDALLAGDVDFAIAWVPKVLGSIESTGTELTDIAQVYQTSGTTQVSFKSNPVPTVADFEGKRIGSWGFGNEWEIFAAMAAEGLDASTVSITTQGFDMSALLNGDVDAAQAMTYNELAQLFETVNPATGKLYGPDDVDIVFYEDTQGAMLQDAIWADTARLAEDPAYADAAVRFLKAVVKGWAYTNEHVEEAATIAYDAAVAGGGYPVGPVHQLWQANEVNKLIWDGGDFGVVDANAWARTVDGALTAINQDGLHLITKEPPASAYDNQYILAALAALKADGFVVPTSYTPIQVELTEGGR